MTTSSMHDTTPLAPPACGDKQEPFTILLSHSLIVANRQALKMRVVDAIEDGRVHVRLDARECGYIDTSGLGVLVSLNRKCRDAGGSLTLCGLNDELLEYLRVIRFDTIFTLEGAAS